MCGIAGLINLNGDPVSPVLIQRMTDAIAHRGPDGEGQWIEGNVGIGHRRLAILDPSPSGHQPMRSTDGRWVLTYNGEIYNFRELRLELESKGHKFHSNTDSEVVLHALIEWGSEAILRFNGMFAFALWDRRERKMLLARDRYGIKPLYYSFQGDRFAFASESKAIITHPLFRKDLNKAALLEYLTFQNILTDQTLDCDVYSLPAGHWMLLDDDNPSQRLVHQYWDFDFREPDSALASGEYVEELDRLFVQAVQRQLVSDVEIGSYLSGGMDSGSITAVAASSLPQMKTFTCGFDLSSVQGQERAFDERSHAEFLAAHLGTEQYEIVLSARDMERSIYSVARHVEEPRVGQSYPNYFAAKLAGNFVKVVLSGTGGDEIFGGYPWRYLHQCESMDDRSFVEAYYSYWQRLVSNQELRRIVDPIWSEVEGVRTQDIFFEVLLGHRRGIAGRLSDDPINASLYFEAKTFLHGILTVEDKLSMANGLESRVPFLDNDLVDFAMSCPVALKLNPSQAELRIDENEAVDKKGVYFAKTRDGKRIMRNVMARHLPNQVVERAKQGFSSPDATWFRNESRTLVTRILLDFASPIYQVLDAKAVAPLVQEHLDGKKNRRLLIWSLLNLNEVVKDF